MKTIKVIDLLNKIANGITYTKKARIRYFDRKNDYEDECNLSEVAIGFRLYNQNIELNDKVKIIEEPQEHKIPEKIKNLNSDFYEEEVYYENATKEELIKDILTLRHRINEILDYLEDLK